MGKRKRKKGQIGSYLDSAKIRRPQTVWECLFNFGVGMLDSHLQNQLLRQQLMIEGYKEAQRRERQGQRGKKVHVSEGVDYYPPESSEK